MEQIIALVDETLAARSSGEVPAVTPDDLAGALGTSQADQYLAAVRDTNAAAQVLLRNAVSAGVVVRQVLDLWAVRTLLTIEGRFIFGYTRGCQHLDRSLNQPTIAAAWMPEVVVCVRCLPELELEHGSVEDLQCDRCGYVIDTATEVISHGSYVERNLTLLYGACPRCVALLD